jgi:hypothetical protein
MIVASIVTLAFSGAAFGGTVIDPVIVSTDAETGIGPGIVYTHALDFGNLTGATINGVPFTAAGRSGSNFTTANMPGTINENQFNLGGAGTGAAAGSGLHQLLTDFFYNSVNNGAGQSEVITLTGLVPAVPHRLRIFYRQWDANEDNTRFTDITFYDETGDGFIRVNQDESENARMLVYEYTAGPSGTLVIDFFEGGNIPSAASWHQYGLSNEIVPEPTSLGILGVGALALLARRRRA